MTSDHLPSPFGPLGPDERSLRVYAEATGFLIWGPNNLGSRPEEWPISTELREALEAWGQAWENFRPGRHYLYPEDDPAFDIAGHNATGAALVQRLNDELGPEWKFLFELLKAGPPVLLRPQLRIPRTHSVPLKKVQLLSKPLGPSEDPTRYKSAPPPRSELRDGSLLLALMPCYESGFSYAIQALWRGKQALPVGLLRKWAIEDADKPDLIVVSARENLFAAFSLAIRQQVPSQWVSRHEDVIVTILPSEWSPYRQRYVDARSAEVVTSDPPDDGFEVNILFRTQAETGFSPTKSGIALRMSVSPAALNQFMVAFAKAHDDLKLRDEWLSEEQGTFVRARFRWPPEA